MGFSSLPKRLRLGKEKANTWRAKEKPLLPVSYKDKPTRRTLRKRAMIFRGFVLSLFLYAFYSLYYSRNEHYQEHQTNWNQAQLEVKSVFLESWNSYKEYAWGKDVFHPISRTGENMGPKPLGWMIVDSLDTLMIMGCDEELKHARNWVLNDLDYEFDYNVNLFETTIRMLGGLLSAHALSKDDVYLDKAASLAKRLLGAFNSPSGIPYSSVNLLTEQGIKNHVDNGASSTAEVSTLQLEFKYLAHLTGEKLYWDYAEKVMEILDSNDPEDGLVPIYVHPDTGKYQGRLIRLGSRGDSYYEYLLKQYLQTNKQENLYWQMYRESVQGVKSRLVSESVPNGLKFIGELESGIGGSLSTKMDHLVCFYGGLLALGATNGDSYDVASKREDWDSDKESDFQLGKDLTYTCYKMYHDVPSGLSPEIVVFNNAPGSTEDFFIKRLDRHNLQRPETVESLFYLYRLTKDNKYREYGYEIFKNFVKYSKITDGKGYTSYSSLSDVTKVPPTERDNMESFWLSETLKYLYLLFDDENTIPLDQYVFNTEAHPLPRFDLTDHLSTGWKRKNGKGSFTQPDVNEYIDSMKKQGISKPPKAAPADKSAAEQAKEEAKKNPDILKDKKLQLEDII